MNKDTIEKLFEQNKVWPEVKAVLTRLNKKGFSALIVGGAVRDACRAKAPQDFDIACPAPPKELIKIFPQAHFVGKSFGVIWLALKHKKGVEIASFRKEGPYLDGRHPSKVELCSLEEDVKRRDFTINALYYDIKEKKIIDFVGGQKDIQKQIIRAVGKPETRFQEDKLRILRAIRFSSILGFTIEDNTLQAMKNQMPKIHQISKERIVDEMEKTFRTGDFPTAAQLFIDTKLLQILWPEWPWSLDPIWQKNKACPCYFCSNKRDWPVKQISIFFWALLFFPVFFKNLKENSFKTLEKKLQESLKKIILPAQSIKQTVRFFSFYKNMLDSRVRIGKKLKLLNDEPGWVYFDLLKHFLFFKPEENVKQIEFLKQLKEVYDKISSSDKKLPVPFLKGGDFLKEGIPEGPEISQYFDLFYEDQLEGKLKTRQSALKKLHDILKNKSSLK